VLAATDYSLHQPGRLEHADVPGNPGKRHRQRCGKVSYPGVSGAQRDEQGPYAAWQQKDDPTRFVHLFEFADEPAHRAHGASDAVRRFEAIYRPELVNGPVVFTDYLLIATNQRP